MKRTIPMLALALLAGCAAPIQPAPTYRDTGLDDFHRRYNVAWADADRASKVWVFCLIPEAGRLAKISRETPEAVATVALAACSKQEYAISNALSPVGENTAAFRDHTHAHGLEMATARIVTVRAQPHVTEEGKSRKEHPDI